MWLRIVSMSTVNAVMDILCCLKDEHFLNSQGLREGFPRSYSIVLCVVISRYPNRHERRLESFIFG
jgi:hypothetical protein